MHARRFAFAFPPQSDHGYFRSVALAAKAKHIEVCRLGPQEELLVVGDPYRLQQVFWNLLSNAIKFTPERGHVELALAKLTHYARVTVCDSGRGINADLLPYIFEPFRQGENDRNQVKGIGLGLSIVRHIVELHGGSVSADSAGSNQGSKFTVNLPLASQRQQTLVPTSVQIFPNGEDDKCFALELKDNV